MHAHAQCHKSYSTSACQVFRLPQATYIIPSEHATPEVITNQDKVIGS